MNILFVISSLETGGAQKLMGDLLPYFQSDNQDKIKLVVFRNTNSKIEQNLISNGIDVKLLNTHERNPLLIFKLIPFIRWADIVHSHLFPTDYLVMLSNLFIHKPLVFTEHNTHNRRRNIKLIRPLEKLMYKNYSKVICISDATAKSLTGWIGNKLANKRIEIIENGIELNNFNPSENSDPEFFFGRKGIPLLMISRFTEQKDHATLLRALKLLDRKDVYLVLAGEGHLKKEIEQLAKELNIEDSVLFLGNRDDIPQLINHSYIGIQSSHWEGFGLTSIEMMAGGIPVIVSDVEGLSDIVGEAALKFPKGYPHALAKLIKKLLDDKQLYKKYVELGKLKSTEYSIERMAKKYKAVYRSLIKSKK